MKGDIWMLLKMHIKSGVIQIIKVIKKKRKRKEAETL